MPLAVIFSVVFCCLVVGPLRIDAHDAEYRNTSMVPAHHRRVTRYIFPGTKWCGPSDRASHIHDFGTFRDVDECCMIHDNCPIRLLGNEERHGLKNPGRFTICHCDCDRKFYTCLLETGTRLGHILKEIYFTMLNRWCIQEKPRRPGQASNVTEYELVSEYGWRATWDKLKNIYWTVVRMQSDIYIDRYKALKAPVEIPWFCL